MRSGVTGKRSKRLSVDGAAFLQFKAKPWHINYCRRYIMTLLRSRVDFVANRGLCEEYHG